MIDLVPRPVQRLSGTRDPVRWVETRHPLRKLRYYRRFIETPSTGSPVFCLTENFCVILRCLFTTPFKVRGLPRGRPTYVGQWHKDTNEEVKGRLPLTVPGLPPSPLPPRTHSPVVDIEGHWTLVSTEDRHTKPTVCVPRSFRQWSPTDPSQSLEYLRPMERPGG